MMSLQILKIRGYVPSNSHNNPILFDGTPPNFHQPFGVYSSGVDIICCCYAHDLSCALAATLIKLHIYIYTHSLQVRHCGGAGLQGVVTMTYSISCDIDLEPVSFFEFRPTSQGQLD